MCPGADVGSGASGRVPVQMWQRRVGPSPGADVAAARRAESWCRCGSGEFVSVVAALAQHGRSARRSYYDVGVCVLGKRCGYAHGQDELRADPDIGTIGSPWHWRRIAPR